MNLAPRLAHRTPFFYGWVVLGSASSTQIVRNAAASLTIAVFMFPLAEDLGWSRTLIAGAASFGGLAASGASPVVGWLIDRYGARIVLASSVFILGLSTISLAWATVPIAFYLAYGVGRVIFSSPVQIGASVVASRWFIRMRGRASGVLFLSHSIGMITFPLVASIVIDMHGWRYAWVVLGLIVWAVALLPATLLIAQSPEDVGLRPDGDEADESDKGSNGSSSDEEPGWTLKAAMKTPALWILATGTGLLFLMQAGINTHLAAFLRDEGLSPVFAGVGVGLNAAFLGLGSIAWGWIVERVPARHVLTMVAAVMVLGSVLFMTTSSTTQALVYSALFGFGLGGILSVPPVAYADYYGRRSLGTIRGVTEPLTSFGQAIGAVAAGAAFDLTGSYEYAFIAFAALGASTMLMVQLARPPRYVPEATPEDS